MTVYVVLNQSYRDDDMPAFIEAIFLRRDAAEDMATTIRKIYPSGIDVIEMGVIE